MKSGERRLPDQRTHDRALAAGWALEGLPHHEIARRVRAATGRAVTRQTISKDLAAVRAEWRAGRLRDADDWLTLELAKIDHLERTLWRAWYHSGGGDAVVPVDGNSDASVASGQAGARSTRTGDPRFLASILRCLERRARLLGLDAPREAVVEVATGPTGFATGPYERPAVDAVQIERVRERFMEFLLNRGGNGAIPGKPPDAALAAGDGQRLGGEVRREEWSGG